MFVPQLYPPNKQSSVRFPTLDESLSINTTSIVMIKIKVLTAKAPGFAAFWDREKALLKLLNF
jgi:hypothetical protein